MNSPDYSKYTFKQIKEAYNSIDKDMYPQRAEYLKSLIENPNKFKRLKRRGRRSRREILPSATYEKSEAAIAGLVLGFTGIILLYTGKLVTRVGVTEVAADEIRGLVGFLFTVVGFGVFFTDKVKRKRRDK